jgi:2,4-dienoyl-CoA reductase-like NADH-dependent reductase (Old Yellow Enzyme family)
MTGHDIMFSPFRLGSLQLKNRVVMSPMTRSFSPLGVPGANVAEYYARRADTGLIITEGAWIPHEGASNDPSAPRFHGEDALDGWSQVVAAVHAAGGLIVPQLWHVGLFGKMSGDKVVPQSERQVGPSGLLGAMGVAPVKHAAPMSLQQIESLITAYGESAAHACALGFDGVALHGAHGYLIDQFLWDKTNHRDDDYGGDFGRRSRFAAEVVRECRRRTRPDFPIIFRMSQWKLQDYSAQLCTNAKDLEAIVAPLVEEGVNLFDCSQRRFWEGVFPDSPLNLAAWVKRITGMPTMTVGSVGLDVDLMPSLGGGLSQPASLEALYRSFERGEYDLVGVGRAILVDPDWVKKIRTGAVEKLLPFSTAALASLS